MGCILGVLLSASFAAFSSEAMIFRCFSFSLSSSASKLLLLDFSPLKSSESFESRDRDLDFELLLRSAKS
jgi:hypothetical protein